MAIYEIEDPKTGRIIELEGDSPPTEAELEKVFAAVGSSAPSTEADSGSRGATGSFTVTEDEARFPRVNKLTQSGELTKDGAYTTKDALRLGIATAQDAASIPGRAIAALPAMLPGGETYGESYARTEAKHGGTPGRFIGDILRDPASLVTLPFAAGSAAAKAATQGIKQLGIGTVARKGAQLVGRRAGESAVSAVVHQGDKFAQTGKASVGEAAIETGLGTGLGVGLAGLGKLAGGVSDIVQKGPERIMMNRLRPLSKALDDGFDPKNVSKYKLFGEVEDILQTSDAMIKQRTEQLKGIVGAAAKENKTVNLSEVLQKTLDDIQGDKLNRNFATAIFTDNADGKPLQATAEKMAGFVGTLTNKRAQIPVDEALDIKQVVGHLGDWSHGATDPNMAATSTFANKLYLNLRDAIDSQLPDEAKKLNREMHELIPIYRAAKRRLPIEQRNDVIDLKTASILANAFGAGSIPGGGAGLALSIMDKTIKSPMTASALDATRATVNTIPQSVQRLGSIGLNALGVPLRQGVRSNIFMPRQEQQ
jgi:hypothetical protein